MLYPPDILVGLLSRPNPEPRKPSLPEVPSPLRPREADVLRAFARGMSTAEVAATLNITVHTVRTYLRSIMVKLGARSKLEAVVIALRSGLIGLPD